MTSFAALAGGLCPTQEALALGLAAELGCPEGDARARIQALADGLPAARSPHRQLEAVLRVTRALAPAASGTLLLPRALDGGGPPATSRPCSRPPHCGSPCRWRTSRATASRPTTPTCWRA